MVDVEAHIIADLLRESLARGQHPTLTIRSNSMRPLLQAGDQVWLETAVPIQLQSGELITLWDGRDLLTHRYWATVSRGGEQHLVTRGDRPLTLDPLQPVSHLIGRVMARRRGAHRLTLKSGAGYKLNQRLTQLVQWEWRHLLGQNTVAALGYAPGWLPNGRSAERKTQSWKRWVLFGGAWALVAISRAQQQLSSA